MEISYCICMHNHAGQDIKSTDEQVMQGFQKMN